MHHRCGVKGVCTSVHCIYSTDTCARAHRTSHMQSCTVIWVMCCECDEPMGHVLCGYRSWLCSHMSFEFHHIYSTTVCCKNFLIHSFSASIEECVCVLESALTQSKYAISSHTIDEHTFQIAVVILFLWTMDDGRQPSTVKYNARWFWYWTSLEVWNDIKQKTRNMSDMRNVQTSSIVRFFRIINIFLIFIVSHFVKRL